MKIVDAGLAFKSNMTQFTNTPTTVVIHHTASDNSTVESVHSYHQSKGWAGIGYHYLITADGTVYQGRPKNYQGAHVSGHNNYTYGVALVGNFEEHEPTAAQYKACAELLRNEFTNFKVVKHCDLAATACPGKKFDKMLLFQQDEFYPELSKSKVQQVSNLATQIQTLCTQLLKEI